MKESAFRANIAARVLALILAGLALYGLANWVPGLVNTVRRPPSVGILCFGLLFDGIALSIFVWWLRAAWMGWNVRSAISTRWLSAALATIVFGCGLFAASALKLLQPVGVPDSQRNEIVGVLSGFLAISSYVLLSRYFVSRLGLSDERSTMQRKRSVERCVGLFAFLFWSNVFGIALEFVPRAHDTADLSNVPWFFAALFASVLVATVVYRGGVRLLAPKNA